MNKLTKEELVKLAEKWGVKYSLNSDTPGIFINNGHTRKEFTLDDLLEEVPEDCDVDIAISKELRNLGLPRTKKIHSKMTNFPLEENFSGVA